MSKPQQEEIDILSEAQNTSFWPFDWPPSNAEKKQYSQCMLISFNGNRIVRTRVTSGQRSNRNEPISDTSKF